MINKHIWFPAKDFQEAVKRDEVEEKIQKQLLKIVPNSLVRRAAYTTNYFSQRIFIACIGEENTLPFQWMYSVLAVDNREDMSYIAQVLVHQRKLIEYREYWEGKLCLSSANLCLANCFNFLCQTVQNGLDNLAIPDIEYPFALIKKSKILLDITELREYQADLECSADLRIAKL